MLNRFVAAEQPIAELDTKIQELDRILDAQSVPEDALTDAREQRDQLVAQRDDMLRDIFTSLSPWDKVLLARHPQRPYTLDYIQEMCDSFDELHGDRTFGDDPAMVGGIGQLGGRSVVIVGQQKGRNVAERQHRNFGYAGPEGYRKALRLMKLADKFRKPILCLVDTPGAACLQSAEERGISEAIARNQKEMALLGVPVVVVVIGEGGSGGAIGLAVGNKVFMLEHAMYSVIQPEACASIIWRDSTRGAEAAEALKLTAEDALELGIADEILPEPLGGAHRDFGEMARRVKTALVGTLDELEKLTPEELIEQRYQRFRKLGRYYEPPRETPAATEEPAAGAGNE